ncbi:hypothetical protein BD626DRAFT_509856 [Schizophyllum amplum]|uniref:Uncharacterized protein n=1 Tax=Schizophyllum amplum TaxID=97359 RepID=A0A550C233_9AGAR|nr:hypothetical protein BD626DRAFT_509856 [Auriculariopsis ampla]
MPSGSYGKRYPPPLSSSPTDTPSVTCTHHACPSIPPIRTRRISEGDEHALASSETRTAHWHPPTSRRCHPLVRVRSSTRSRALFAGRRELLAIELRVEFPYRRKSRGRLPIARGEPASISPTLSNLPWRTTHNEPLRGALLGRVRQRFSGEFANPCPVSLSAASFPISALPRATRPRATH